MWFVTVEVFCVNSFDPHKFVKFRVIHVEKTNIIRVEKVNTLRIEKILVVPITDSHKSNADAHFQPF